MPDASGFDIGAYIARFAGSWLAGLGLAPWEITARAADLVAARLPALDAAYRIGGGVAVHASASIEPGAVLKPPLIVGPRCRVASGAYLRGGVWLERDCTAGPGAEFKAAFLFAGAAAAHFNFVGDSLLGAGVNLEAGAIVANHRNERPDASIVLAVDGRRIDTGASKFGAVVGDGARVGANAVLAPGAVLARGTVVPRLGLVDQAAG